MRRIVFYFEEAFANFMSVKFRSLLTILSLLIGTASIVAMIYGGELATSQSLEQFKTLGTDLFAVNIYPNYSAKQKSDETISVSMNFSLINGLKDVSPSILMVGPYTTVFAPIAFQGEALDGGNIIGCGNTLAKIIRLPLLNGRFVSSIDRYSLFCVLGHDFYEKIKQRYPEPIGQQIQLGHYLFTIIGIAGPIENSFIYADLNRAIFIPLDATTLLDPHLSTYNAVMQINPNANVDALSSSIQQYFSYHAPNKKLYIRSAKQYILQMEKQREIMEILLGLIGSISLIVGGIGVMNIMLVSVAERRKEIGIRLAIGAKRYDIQWLFLIEAICLSLIGGVLGIVFGLLTAFLVAHFQHWKWEFFFIPILIGFGVSFLTGIAFGFYPAYRASQLTPIETLRSE